MHGQKNIKKSEIYLETPVIHVGKTYGNGQIISEAH